MPPQLGAIGIKANPEPLFNHLIALYTAQIPGLGGFAGPPSRLPASWGLRLLLALEVIVGACPDMHPGPGAAACRDKGTVYHLGGLG